MDKEQMNLPPQPYEFRSKPAWQRLIIMLGGVTVNVILALVIFIMIMWIWGERYIPVANLKYGVSVDSLATKIGMQEGDKILAVAGKPLERVGTTGSEIIMNEAKSLTIERNGQRMELAIPAGFINQLNKNRLGGFTYIKYQMVVDTIVKEAQFTGPALQKGDTMLTVAGMPAYWYVDMGKAQRYLDKNKLTTVAVTALRGTDTIRTTIAGVKDWNIHVYYKDPEDILGYKHITYTLPQAIPAGVKKSVQTLTNYIRNLRLLFTSKEVKAEDSLGSVVSIANVFPPVWDWQAFWTLTAIFSILLAFMNVLPIPALDGGHALFTLVEMITGRKPSDKFIEYAQMVGMILLFALMAYALGLDIFRIFRK
jgi:regulator of sigma E protease